MKLWFPKPIIDHSFVPSPILGPNRCTVCSERREDHAGFLGRLYARLGGWNFWGPEDQ